MHSDRPTLTVKFLKQTIIAAQKEISLYPIDKDTKCLLYLQAEEVIIPAAILLIKERYEQENLNFFKLYRHYIAETHIQFLSVVKHLDLVELRIVVCGLVFDLNTYQFAFSILTLSPKVNL